MQMKNLAVLVALPMALVACGGGGGGSSSGGGIVAGSTIQSQFIDAPVKGLKVEKLSGNSETGANGVFTCKSGEVVNFWLKEIGAGKTGLFLGSATCGSKIYIDEIGANANEAGALIQSLAVGDHNTRTELDLSAFNATTFDVSSVDIDNLTDGAITTLVSDVTTANPSLLISDVTLNEARTHMNTYLPKLDDAAMTKLALAAQNGAWVTLNKVSGTDCIDKMSAKIRVAELAVDGKKSYRFSVEAALGHTIGDGLDTDAEFEAACLDEENFYCISDPIAPRYLTGRSLTLSNYKSGSETYPADMPICVSADGSQSEWGNPDCTIGTKYVLDKEYKENWVENLNVAMSINDTGYSIKLDDYWSGMDVNLSSASGGKIGLSQLSGSCSFSATGTF